MLAPGPCARLYRAREAAIFNLLRPQLRPTGPYVTALGLILVGVVLAVGGVRLIALGGSWYYALAGVGVLAAGVLLWRGKERGVLLYGLVFVATLAWAFYEVGLGLWALAPRVLAPAAMGVWLGLPWVQRKLDVPPAQLSTTRRLVRLHLAINGLAIAFMVLAVITVRALHPPMVVPQAAAEEGVVDWPQTGRSVGGSRYAPAIQINPQNVGALHEAWVYHTGFADPTLETTPIIAAGMLVFCTARDEVVALDPETGEQRWRYDPEVGSGQTGLPACRGLAHDAASGGALGARACAERLYLATQDARLIALDAATGEPCPLFAGNRDMRLADGAAPQIYEPPLAVNNLVVVGAPVVRAFDSQTGAPAWSTDIHAGSALSADADLGLLYFTAEAAGGDTNVVALDLASGRQRWSFALAHHGGDSAPAQPVVVDLPSAQGARHVLVQAAKRGDLFVLDRATGAPIFPVTERDGQPRSSVSLAPPALNERDMWGLTPIDQLFCRLAFKEVRSAEPFAAPGPGPSLRFPGSFGAIDWGGVSVDEGRATLVANTNATADIESAGKTHPFLGLFSVPCTAPPWGRISAVDLSTGQVVWAHPMGTAYDSGPAYLASRIPLPMGVPNLGGAITTRSGLTFVAASLDAYLRAFDTRTGQVLWRGRLPAAGHSTPMTYVTASGRQFVVIAAGGHSGMGPALGDAIIAYSLPGNLVTPRAQTPSR